MALDQAGNIYAGGVTGGAFPGQTLHSRQDFFIVKYDAVGNLIWVVQDGPNASGEIQLSGLAVDTLGNVYLAGNALGMLDGQGSDKTSGFLSKYTSNGIRQWTVVDDGFGCRSAIERICHRLDE